MKKSHFFIGMTVTLGLFACIAALFLLEPKPGAREPLLILIGALSAAFGAFMQYTFGSSLGSDRKTELLSKAPPVEDPAKPKETPP